MGSSSDSENLDFSSITQEENLLSANTGFDEEGFDDVFIDDPPSADLESPSGIPIRARRTSDLIDSVGGLSVSSVPTLRHSFLSANGEMFSFATSQATNIVEGLNGSVRAELTTESIDLGYSSPGARNSSLSKECTWFRTSINSDADSIDAKPIEKGEQNSVLPVNSNSSGVSNKTDKAVKMPVNKDSLLYNMDHEYRGFAVIINQEHFNTVDLGDRTGTNADVEELKSMFYKLDFAVVVWNNLDQKDIMENLKNLAAHDHSDNDCLAITVLTHGIGSSFIYAKDSLYPVDLLWKPFTADKCKTLAGKPKMFFVQACRGQSLDSGVVLSPKLSTQTDGSSSDATYKIPTHADFLIAFSSYDGYYSFRHPVFGTWFIQSLCKEVADNDLGSLDFLSLMTRVSRRVALEYDSHAPESPWMHDKKQIPTIHSMLIRDLYFKRKNAPPPEPEIIM